MRFMNFVLCIIGILLISRAQCADSKGKSQKLMLILLDGFRWDYVEKYNLVNFKRFYKDGVRAKNMESVFPSFSFPNYYSITTGLYPENHGIVGNMMYDTESGDRFVFDRNQSHLKPHWWEDARPIWVSVEKQGKSAYVYRWLGSEVSIHGTHPRWYIPYSGIPITAEFRDATREGLVVLRNGSADFVGIYHGDPDRSGHVNGPDSPKVGSVLLGIDGIVGSLLDEMKRLNSDEMINLMIVSDHGMTNIDRSRVINITTILTSDLYTTITEDDGICEIFLSDPKLENKVKVYNLLANLDPHMKVYKRVDIPDRFHFKNGKHVPEILCIADLGWVIVHPVKPTFFMDTETGNDMKGTHGYDNSLMDMRGIFYGMGPYFKAGSSVESIRIVDLYNTMCEILNITPMPNNGTIQHISPLLASSKASSFYSRINSSQSIALLAFIIVLFH